MNEQANYSIRHAESSDLDAAMAIYVSARAFMHANGNPHQWLEGYPEREIIADDIAAHKTYLCCAGSEICAVFYFAVERDPTYTVIDGAWLDDEPYGVVHRIARSADAHHVGGYCIQWCLQQCGDLRIDTHRDNQPMRDLLERLGFSYCGIIWTHDGSERLAFQKLLPKAAGQDQ